MVNIFKIFRCTIEKLGEPDAAGYCSLTVRYSGVANSCILSSRREGFGIPWSEAWELVDWFGVGDPANLAGISFVTQHCGTPNDALSQILVLRRHEACGQTYEIPYLYPTGEMRNYDYRAVSQALAKAVAERDMASLRFIEQRMIFAAMYEILKARYSDADPQNGFLDLVRYHAKREGVIFKRNHHGRFSHLTGPKLEFTLYGSGWWIFGNRWDGVLSLDAKHPVRLQKRWRIPRLP